MLLYTLEAKSSVKGRRCVADFFGEIVGGKMISDTRDWTR
jgi:hypothetical protein